MAQRRRLLGLTTGAAIAAYAGALAALFWRGER